MKNQIRRIYPYADAYMLSSAELFYTFYEERYLRFNTFDPVLFIEGYGVTLKSNTDTGFSAERDSLVTEQVSKESGDVTESVELFLEQYDDLLYYVDKCFSNEPDIQKQFHHRVISDLMVRRPLPEKLWMQRSVYPESGRSFLQLRKQSFTS